LSKYIHIHDEHIEKILDQVKRLLERYHRSIDLSYTENDNEISVKFTTKIKPNKYDGIDVNTGINFVTGQVKDSLEDNISSNRQQQTVLPFKPKAKPRPRPRMTEGVKRRMRGYQFH